MNKEIITEAYNKIDDAHGQITCITSVLDILQAIEPSGYKNVNVLQGDISNTLALVSEKLGEQLVVIELALQEIRKELKN